MRQSEVLAAFEGAPLMSSPHASQRMDPDLIVSRPAIARLEGATARADGYPFERVCSAAFHSRSCPGQPAHGHPVRLDPICVRYTSISQLFHGRSVAVIFWSAVSRPI